MILFAIAPENEDAGKENGEAEGEPGSVRDFRESRGKVETVEGAEDEEASYDDGDVKTPYYEGDKGDHAGRYEGDKDHADAVGLTELSRLCDCESVGWFGQGIDCLRCCMLRSHRLSQP